MALESSPNNLIASNLAHLYFNQTTIALEAAKNALQTAMHVLADDMTNADREIQSHLRLLHAGQEFLDVLEVGVYAARFCQGPAGQNLWWLRRLSGILLEVRGCYKAWSEVVKGTWSPRNEKLADCLVEQVGVCAGAMLWNSRKGLESLVAIVAEGERGGGCGGGGGGGGGGAGSLSFFPTKATKTRPLNFNVRTSGAYLREDALFEWEAEIFKLRDMLTHEDELETVVEKVDGEGVVLSRIETGRDAIWSNEYEETRPHTRSRRVAFDGVNAIWLSPVADALCLFNKEDARAYQDLVRKIHDTDEEEKKKKEKEKQGGLRARSRDYFRPIQLARGLRLLQIDLGFVMSDDRSEILWPLGKRNLEESGRGLVILCKEFERKRWRFSALSMEKKPPTDDQMAPSTTDEGDKTPSPDTFRFLDLPVELRNEIYLYYFATDDLVAKFPTPDIAPLEPPVLCRVSRQIRDEVLHLFFVNYEPHIYINGNAHTSPKRFLRQQVLTTRNRWLSHTPYAHNLKSFVFHFGYGIAAESIRLKLTTDEPQGYELRYPGDMVREPAVKENWVVLERIVENVVRGRRGRGFSLNDVAVVACWLYEHSKQFEREIARHSRSVSQYSGSE